MKNFILISCLALAGSTATAQTDKPVRNDKVITLSTVEIVYPSNHLLVYPNPATNIAELKPDQDFKLTGFFLEVFDNKGIKIVNKLWDGAKLDVSKFPNGSYIVTLRKGRKYYSQKLVVNR